MDNKQLWENVLVEVEGGVSKANFSTWFKNTHIVKQENGIVYVGVPNEFIKEWLTSKYNKVIFRSLRNTSETIRGVEYTIVSSSMKEREKRNAFAPERMPLSAELPLNDLYINREDNLNPRYTFESLIVGPFNELAHAAAVAVVKQPGSAYNPLFIYGGTGLGKTHMLQAIGNTLKNEKSGRKIYYVTSEKFLIDYTNSVMANRGNEFKEKYRKYDLLIMDDIQLLSGKDKTQEELFHLFNALHENGKQIIFSSDKHPNYLNGLEDRLKSRFGAGMIVDITTPEYESRTAIIRHKMRQNNTAFNDDVIHFMSSSLECSVREIEGVINLVICQMRVKQRDLSVNEVKALIKNNIIPKKTASIKDIIHAVSQFYNIEESTLYEKTRRKEVVRPRQIAMYLLREDYSVSYPTIGERFGGRDHTTVIHSCDKIKDEIKTDSVLISELDQIRAML